MALERLGRTSPAVANVISLLIAACKEEDAGLRAAAVEALGKTETKAEGELPAALEVLADKRPPVRIAAAMAAWRLDPRQAGRAVGVLIAALKGSDKDIRCRAAGLLGDIGPAARDAVPALLIAADDPNVGEAAADALRRIDAGK